MTPSCFFAVLILKQGFPPKIKAQIPDIEGFPMLRYKNATNFF